MKSRDCYCPTCGTPTEVPPDLGRGAITVCGTCELAIMFPGGPALFFEKVSELTMDGATLRDVRVMRAQLRQQKAQAH